MPLRPLKDSRDPLASLRGVVILALGFSTLLPLNLLQLLSLAVLPFSRKAFRGVNRWCADTWWGWCVAGAERFNNTKIIFTGEDVPKGENVLLVSNHQQMPDIPAIMKLAKTKDRLGDLKFFVKKQLKWVPGMGWGMQFLDCLFIDRDWASDREKIRRTFARLVDDEVPLYLVSFVEGTRLTLPKLEAAQHYARQNGLREPRQTLVPRSKGFAASVEGLRNHIDAVYDLTIAYEGGVPSLWQFIKGMVERVHMHVRRFPIAELPDSTDGLRDWLFARFEEKDRLLEHFYETEAFPTEPFPDSL
jgi:1-acyl-sn-glycerol-3-phosphate acyltransferase